MFTLSVSPPPHLLSLSLSLSLSLWCLSACVCQRERESLSNCAAKVNCLFCFEHYFNYRRKRKRKQKRKKEEEKKRGGGGGGERRKEKRVDESVAAIQESSYLEFCDSANRLSRTYKYESLLSYMHVKTKNLSVQTQTTIKQHLGPLVESLLWKQISLQQAVIQVLR